MIMMQFKIFKSEIQNGTWRLTMSKDGIKYHMDFHVSLKSPAALTPTVMIMVWGPHFEKQDSSISSIITSSTWRTSGQQAQSWPEETCPCWEKAVIPDLKYTYFLGETDSSNIVDSSSPSSPNLSLLCFWGKTRQTWKLAGLDTRSF